MTAPGLVIPLTPADIALHREWDDAVAASMARPLGLEEMVDRLFSCAYQRNSSARAAKRAFGTPFDERILREYIAEQKAARFFQDHPDEVVSILRGGTTAKRARRS